MSAEIPEAFVTLELVQTVLLERVLWSHGDDELLNSMSKGSRKMSAYCQLTLYSRRKRADVRADANLHETLERSPRRATGRSSRIGRAYRPA
jgi:hypothetical protein